MSLLGRLDRLERALGDDEAPKHVIVSTVSNRHEIRRDGPDRLRLGIPWKAGYVRAGGVDPTGGRAVFIGPQGYGPGHVENPLDALTEEQQALIGPRDKVAVLCLPPGRRRRQAGEGTPP
jgi:hypothetical protein